MPSQEDGTKYYPSIFWVVVVLALLFGIINQLSLNALWKKTEQLKVVTPTNEPSTAVLLPNIQPDKIAPVDFIKALTKQLNPEFVVGDGLDHWITKKDLPTLLALVDSKERCSSVASEYSSVSSPVWSTVGDQALFMLEGYRKGKYPPYLNLVQFGDKKYRDELIAWARSQQ